MLNWRKAPELRKKEISRNWLMHNRRKASDLRKKEILRRNFSILNSVIVLEILKNYQNNHFYFIY